MNSGRTAKTRSVWPSLWVTVRWRRWSWIDSLKPADPHILWDACYRVPAAVQRLIIVWIYLLTKQQLRLVRRTLARGSCGEFSPKLLSRSLPRLVHDDHLRGKVMEFKEVYGSVGELRRSHRESVDGLTVLLSNCGYMWYIIILKLFQNCFSVLFPYNHVWNWNKIILAAETSSEIISATLNVFEDICELR